MDESNSSSSASSLGELLLKYRNKIKQHRLSKRSVLEESQNSNTNLPSSSAFALDSEPTSKKVKRVNPKRTQKKIKMTTSKNRSPRSITSNNSIPKHPGTLTALDYVKKRAGVSHEMGIVLSDEEDITSSPTRHKKPKKSISEGMSESERNLFINRQAHLFHMQQKNLLKHPEIIDVDNTDDVVTTPVPLPVLSEDKREWVQKFIDSMTVDRVDYDKPKQLNIIEGISHKRASDVHFKDDSQLADSLDAKTILERVDFEKEKERQCKMNERIKISQENATSTPKPALKNLISIKESPIPILSPEEMSVIRVIPSTSKITNNCLLDVTLPEKPNIFTSTRIGSILEDCDLDCSNVTIRTPRSRLVEAPRSNTPAPIKQNKDMEIMNFVEHLLAAEEETINQHANELCEKYGSLEQSEKVLQDALDQILTTNNNPTDQSNEQPENSVQIIEPILIPNDNNYNNNDDSVQIIESDDDVIPTTSIIDIVDSPSVPVTSRRWKRALRSRTVVIGITPVKRRKSQAALPSIAEAAVPSGSINTSAIAENNTTVRSLSNCPICMESLADKEISSTICGHVFCTPCITTAVRSRRRCPNCRSALTLKKIHPLFL